MFYFDNFNEIIIETYFGIDGSVAAIEITNVRSVQGQISLPSDRKHKPNSGAPSYTCQTETGGREEKEKEDSTNTIVKTHNTFLVLSVIFYIHKCYRSCNAEKVF